MDEKRMDTLLKHIDSMDSSLADRLDRYRSFANSEKPRIAVVCSEKVLFSEMSLLFTDIEGADITIYPAYDSQSDMYGIMLSDAVIAVTSALRIAPAEFTELINGLKAVAKEVYFLLGGWGIIQRSPEQAAAKEKRVTDTFAEVAVRTVHSYFKVPCEGYSLPEDAARELVGMITRDAARLHENQEERLYAYLKSMVRDHYDRRHASLDDQYTKASSVKQLTGLKRDEYVVRLSHLAVNVQAVADRVMAKVSEIRTSDIIFSGESGFDDMRTLFLSDKKGAEKRAKQRTAELMSAAIEAVKQERAFSVKDSGEALESECRADMLGAVSRLKVCTDIPEELMSALGAAAGDTSAVRQAGQRYDEMVAAVIDAVKGSVPSIVGSYTFSKRPGATDLLAEKGRKLADWIMTEEKEKSADGVLPESNNNPSDDYNDRCYELFLEDVKELLNSSSAQALNLLQSNAVEIKRSIDAASKEALVGYFNKICTALDEIMAALDKQKAAFVME